MDPSDVKYLKTAKLMLEAFESSELAEAAENFRLCLSYASTSSHLLPEHDRRTYIIRLSTSRIQLLGALIGKQRVLKITNIVELIAFHFSCSGILKRLARSHL